MSKFLNHDEMLNIEKHLKHSFSFGKIARLMDKDCTTISKEIKKYSFEKSLVPKGIHITHVSIDTPAKIRELYPSG